MQNMRPPLHLRTLEELLQEVEHVIRHGLLVKHAVAVILGLKQRKLRTEHTNNKVN
jgi:hypothetical protein